MALLNNHLLCNDVASTEEDAPREGWIVMQYLYCCEYSQQGMELERDTP